MSTQEWETNIIHNGFIKVQEVSTLPGSTSSSDKRKIIYTTDTDKYYVSDGSNWKEIGLVDHNDLDNIQGGSASERYHLTQTRRASIVNASPIATAGNPVATEAFVNNYDHNDLNNIQGGSAAERYHLSEVHNDAIDNASPSATTTNPVMTEDYRAFGGIDGAGELSDTGGLQQFDLFTAHLPFQNTSPNDGDDDIEIDRSGKYRITLNTACTINVQVLGDTSGDVDFNIEKNNGNTTIASVNLYFEETVIEVRNISIVTFADLDALDTIEFWVNWTEDFHLDFQDTRLMVEKLD